MAASRALFDETKARLRPDAGAVGREVEAHNLTRVARLIKGREGRVQEEDTAGMVQNHD